MNLNEIVKLAHNFYILAKAEKLPENSNNLKIILTNLAKLKTYQARQKYAEKNLEYLSSGSSRRAYKAEKNKIIKLAKNEKGIAQNKTESNCKMKSRYINKVHSHAQNFVWIKVDFVSKIDEKEFEKLTKINFEQFGKAIKYGLKKMTESEKDKPKNFEQISRSDLYKEMKRLGNQFKLMPGDMARISSWGKKNNSVILIDAGLNKNVFEKFYEK